MQSTIGNSAGGPLHSPGASAVCWIDKPQVEPPSPIAGRYPHTPPILAIAQYVDPPISLPHLPPRECRALPAPLGKRVRQPSIIVRVQIKNVLHLGERQGDLKVGIDGLEQVAHRHRPVLVDDNWAPESRHVASIACDDDRVRVCVGDGTPPDASHVDNDMVRRQPFGGGRVLRDIPVNQGQMGVIGVWNDIRGETNRDVAGPVEWGPRSRGPLGHRARKGMSTCIVDACPRVQRVSDIRVGLRMGTPCQMTSGECPDVVVRRPGW